ncbi:MAG: tRNA (adenosine(37)-N6)-threonylcarbamoyltransferase complex ATPase subunit type 1 TsaE [Gammaproteobacteria bacterium]|nr:tRNA (adenosine(37)-N6)-threonylcarbamoyltransferase complex ATPase subunit type 1 TsaE [Gammaproteobacteria bacterium]
MELMLAQSKDTEALGAALARAASGPLRIYLRGNLGVGKTTLVRGFLRGRGYRGAVKSPTYTLMEPYEDLAPEPVYHLDLYRLADPDELQYLGLDELESRHAVVLVEWPEQGSGALPPPDVTVDIEYEPAGRRARLGAATAAGERVLSALVFFAPAKEVGPKP